MGTTATKMKVSYFSTRTFTDTGFSFHYFCFLPQRPTSLTATHVASTAATVSSAALQLKQLTRTATRRTSVDVSKRTCMPASKKAALTRKRAASATKVAPVRSVTHTQT